MFFSVIIVLIHPPSSLPFPQSTSSRISSDMGANLSLLYPSVLVSIAGSLLWLKAHLFHSSRPPLPPGPKGKPIVGNMLDLPKSGQHEWLHWAKHRRQYGMFSEYRVRNEFTFNVSDHAGPISSLSIMGHKLIIINDYTSAMDLLDKRSLNFSDRPDLTFAGVM